MVGHTRASLGHFPGTWILSLPDDRGTYRTAVATTDRGFGGITISDATGKLRAGLNKKGPIVSTK